MKYKEEDELDESECRNEEKKIYILTWKDYENDENWELYLQRKQLLGSYIRSCESVGNIFHSFAIASVKVKVKMV